MLDTDVCSYVMKRSSQRLLARLRSTPPSDVCMSVITRCELAYGVQISPQRERNQAALEGLLRHVVVLDFPEEAAGEYTRIRADLKRRGAMIGAHDLFIAAHALTLGLTLVTNNVGEFGRVAGLAVENWMA